MVPTCPATSLTQVFHNPLTWQGFSENIGPPRTILQAEAHGRSRPKWRAGTVTGRNPHAGVAEIARDRRRARAFRTRVALERAATQPPQPHGNDLVCASSAAIIK